MKTVRMLHRSNERSLSHETKEDDWKSVQADERTAGEKKRRPFAVRDRILTPMDDRAPSAGVGVGNSLTARLFK